MSHRGRTTIFSVKCLQYASPRPHVPIKAMLSLLLRRQRQKLIRGRMSPAAPVRCHLWKEGTVTSFHVA